VEGGGWMEGWMTLVFCYNPDRLFIFIFILDFFTLFLRFDPPPPSTLHLLIMQSFIMRCISIILTYIGNNNNNNNKKEKVSAKKQVEGEVEGGGLRWRVDLSFL